MVAQDALSVHHSHLLVPIIHHINPVHTLSYFFKKQFCMGWRGAVMCNQQPLLPKSHPHLLMVQPVLTNTALETQSLQHNRSVWIEGNAN